MSVVIIFIQCLILGIMLLIESVTNMRYTNIQKYDLWNIICIICFLIVLILFLVCDIVYYEFHNIHTYITLILLLAGMSILSYHVYIDNKRR
jgi:hypothetical protein